MPEFKGLPPLLTRVSDVNHIYGYTIWVSDVFLEFNYQLVFHFHGLKTPGMWPYL